MYNGIGITTARGTGTNGYVQKNLSYVPPKRERVEYVKDVEMKNLEKLIEKKGNTEILEHEKKRRIEVKCIEMRDMMLNNGYDEETTNQKVQKFRKVLIEREGLYDKTDIEYDEFGRPVAKETHQLAQANDEKNRRLREAFGIEEYDQKNIAKRKADEAKEAERRKAELANRQYTIVQEEDEEEHEPVREAEPEKEPEVVERTKKDKEKKKDKEDRHRHKSRDEKKRKSSPEPTKERSSHKHSKKHRHERDRSDDEDESRHRRRRERSPSN